MTLLFVLAVGTFMAYVNGANDVSKGIATLVGSGVADYRRAVVWGTAWTVAGAMAATLVAGAMVTTFGKGILAASVQPSIATAMASLIGAASWVFIATRVSLPVSTTHAIVGSLTGVAVFAFGTGGVEWTILAAKVGLPLALSPLVSLGLTVALLRVGRVAFGRVPNDADCLCASVEAGPVSTAGGAAVLPMRSALRFVAAPTARCAHQQPEALRLRLDHLHWLTSGCTSFARGLNDAPKMAALVLGAAALSPGAGPQVGAVFGAVAAGMFLGSLVGGRRVTKVLAEKVTAMDHREGFVANFVTATLVAAGALGGMPMSTTHVAASGIIGAGLQRDARSINPRVLRDLLLAWAVTLPGAAALGVFTYVLWGLL